MNYITKCIALSFIFASYSVANEESRIGLFIAKFTVIDSITGKPITARINMPRSDQEDGVIFSVVELSGYHDELIKPYRVTWIGKDFDGFQLIISASGYEDYNLALDDINSFSATTSLSHPIKAREIRLNRASSDEQ